MNIFLSNHMHIKLSDQYQLDILDMGPTLSHQIDVYAMSAEGSLLSRFVYKREMCC